MLEVIPSAFAGSTLIGESFVVEGVNAARINAVLGRTGGPVETARATAWVNPGAEDGEAVHKTPTVEDVPQYLDTPANSLYEAGR